MARLIIFRGKSATGKTILSTKISEKLDIFVIRKDNIFDPVSIYIPDNSLTNEICYNVIVNIVQENLNSNLDVILDVALANTNSFKYFLSKLKLKNHVLKMFLCDCSNEDIWISRWEKRIQNPEPNQLFKNIGEVIKHYKKMNIELFENEIYIDSCNELNRNISLVLANI